MIGAGGGRSSLAEMFVTYFSTALGLTIVLAGQSILARQHLAVSLGEPGVTRAVIGSALYLVVAGLIGLGLGTLLYAAILLSLAAIRMRRGDV